MRRPPSTVGLALGGFPVWSVGHMFGPIPTAYTWGYYRSEVSYVFGRRLERAFISRLHAWREAMTRANTCRRLPTFTELTIDTAEEWLKLRTCFHARYNDPPEPPRAPTPTDMAADAGTGLRNVLLWDLAFLMFTQRTPANTSAATTMTKLLTNVARYGDPNGPSPSVLPRTAPGREQLWERQFDGGRERRLLIRQASDTHVEAYSLTPYTSMLTFSGCKVAALRGAAEALHVQMNLTGVPPPRRRAAVALMNWVLRGGRAGNASHGAEDVQQADPLHPQGPAARGEERFVDLQRCSIASVAVAAAAA